MVPEVEFTSYYGRPVVKAPPWGEEIPAYLFLGGMAGGSALLAYGAQLTGLDTLRRNARLGALGAIGLGSVALVMDLGRPERFLNMLRTIKFTSPMSFGSWMLVAFSGGAGVAAASEIDRLTGERLPLGPLRTVARALEGPAGFGAALFATPLVSYTAVLLADTAVPTWNGAHKHLPFVFTSSASVAGAGLAMLTTPVAETRPARVLAVLGAISEIATTKVMERAMDPVLVEPHLGLVVQVQTEDGVRVGRGDADDPVLAAERVGLGLPGDEVRLAVQQGRRGVGRQRRGIVERDAHIPAVQGELAEAQTRVLPESQRKGQVADVDEKPVLVGEE